MSTTLRIVEASLVSLVVQDPEDDSVLVMDSSYPPILEVTESRLPGAQGTPGIGGSSTRVDFPSAGTWIYAHNLGRIPFVLAYLPDGTLLLADIAATTINLTVTHASPQSGFVLFF